MKVTIAIELPCTQEEWTRLEQIRSLAGSENVSIPERGRRFESPEVLEAEFQGELLLEQCILNGVGKCKPTQVQLIHDYISQNPSCLPRDMYASISESHGKTLKQLTQSLNNLIYTKKTVSKIDGRLDMR